MLAIVIVLAVTNVATFVVVVVLLRGRLASPADDGAPDPRVAEALATHARPGSPNSSAGGTRRVISIEILNPIELASVRGRMFGIAGSFVPHLTRRVVYDQTVRQLREQLTAHHVVADVRVHVIAPAQLRAADPTPQLDVTIDEAVAFGPDPAYDPPVQ